MKLAYYISLAAFLTSCSPEVDEETAYDSDTTYQLAENAGVKIEIVRKTSFSKEIISNGKLSAVQKADLQFRSSENIAHIYFKNGDLVKKGQLIASLDNFTLKNTLDQAIEQLEKAKLDFADLLIGQGYNLNDSANIPKNILSTARIKSGFERAKNQMELALYNYWHSELRAPFTGVLADIKIKENNMAGNAEKFCTIIDNSTFEAEFFVLENELPMIRKGQSVRIIPYSASGMEFSGQISQINPIVDKNGMVLVKAICYNKNNLLAEGMNVKAIIEDKVEKQLVIPKSALVLRSGKQVVFTMQNGQAKWKYVNTGLENSTSFTINEGLKDGDTVIIEGSINLAHDSKVEIIKE